MQSETFKEPSQREDAKKLVKKHLEERYASGKNKWFFQPLRVRKLFLSYMTCTHCYLYEYSSRFGPFSFGLLRMPPKFSPCVHTIPYRCDQSSSLRPYPARRPAHLRHTGWLIPASLLWPVLFMYPTYVYMHLWLIAAPPEIHSNGPIFLKGLRR